MPITQPAHVYSKMLFRAASIMQSEDGTAYETDLAEIRLGKESFYFIKDPATNQFGYVCPHDSKLAVDALEKSEARPFAISDKAQIKNFVNAANCADGVRVTEILSGLVKLLEDAKLKGRGY